MSKITKVGHWQTLRNTQAKTKQGQDPISFGDTVRLKKNLSMVGEVIGLGPKGVVFVRWPDYGDGMAYRGNLELIYDN